MHCRDIVERCGQSGADRPDGLVGDDEVVGRGTVRDRSGELGCDDVGGPSRLALHLRLADAEDRHQPRAPRAENLLAHRRIAFAVAVAALGVTENDMAATGVGQHLGADVTGISTLGCGMAILTAEGDAAAGERSGHRRQQARRRADEKLAAWTGVCGRDCALGETARQCRAVRAQPVHLPIAGDEFCPNRHVATPWARLYLWSNITPVRWAGQPTAPQTQRPSASMLQAIRSKAGSFIVKGLFGLLILTFGIWGIGDIFRNRPTDTVIATVGDRNIRAEDLQTAVRREVERMSARVGSPIDLQQAKKFGIVDEVLNGLIDRSLLGQEAARLRLEVSDDVIRNAITDNPSFRTTDGHFDRVRFDAALAQNHLTEGQYVNMMRQDLPPEDLAQAVTLGAMTPQSMADALLRYRNEKRVADIVALSVADAGDAGQPSETDLTVFYDGHQDLFRAPEYRGFTLASLSPSDLAQGIEIPEAKLQEEFDQRQDEFQVPEQREVQQILATSEDKVKEAAAALAAGKDWKEVATGSAGQDPDTIELGLMKREELPRVLGDIAFELPVNKPSEPVKTPLGWHILRVVKIEPAATQTFEQAKPKLEAELTHDEAVDRIYKVANRVDDALAGGMTIEDAVVKFALKKTEIAAADVGGHDPEGKPVSLPVPVNDVMKLIFATDAGQTSRVTESPDGGIFMVQESKVTPPTVKPLAEVKDQAVAAWQDDKRRETVASTAAELAAAVGPGARLAAVAAEKGLKVTTAPPLLRQASPGETTSPALVAKLFAAKPGEVVTATDAAGSYVAQLDEVQAPEAPSPSAVAEISGGLSRGMRADLATEFTAALRARYPVEIRREAVDKLF